MTGKLEVSLDKLPIKRAQTSSKKTASNDFHRYEEKRESLIRRIDFSWAVEKDEEKKKKKKKRSRLQRELGGAMGVTEHGGESTLDSSRELSVIVDLIYTVEANDAVTVARMTRPRPPPNEAFSDLAVSAATKLQCFRHESVAFGNLDSSVSTIVDFGITHQVASQVVCWLHEEARMVGIKANRDFLCLSFELEQGETLSLVAHVDPEDSEGCISWWLIGHGGWFCRRIKTQY